MIGNPYLHITIFIPLLNNPIVFTTRLYFHRNIDIFPYVLRQRNSNTSRINQRNFRQLSICHILIIVKEIIYKKAPMSDDEIVRKLKDQGVTIARRTAAKYRKILNIPAARMRREY